MKKKSMKRGKLANVKVSFIKRKLRAGATVGTVAAELGVSRVALYAKFPTIKGISGRGNRVKA